MRLTRNLMMASAAALSLSATGALAERGSDGQLNILYWQAVSILNPFLSGGTKDVEGASLVLEPLARYNQNGEMVPWLADRDPDGGERRRRRRPDVDHLETEARPEMVGRHRRDRLGRGVHLAVLHTRKRRLPAGDGLRERGERRGGGPDDRQGDLRHRQALPLHPFVGARAPIIQEAQFKDCIGGRAARVHRAELLPHRHRPFVVKDFRPTT
jgi:peptide/nickel transport system substrate-binding protein